MYLLNECLLIISFYTFTSGKSYSEFIPQSYISVYYAIAVSAAALAPLSLYYPKVPILGGVYMFTQILRRARKNVAVHSEGDIFTQSLREHVKMLQSIVEEICSPRFYREHGKMLHWNFLIIYRT